jgi:ubiquinone/menaquinone biosynthesis C-methylase UbiE
MERFPGAERLAERLRAAGFSDVTFERLTLGTVAIHVAEA